MALQIAPEFVYLPEELEFRMEDGQMGRVTATSQWLLLVNAKLIRDAERIAGLRQELESAKLRQRKLEQEVVSLNELLRLIR